MRGIVGHRKFQAALVWDRDFSAEEKDDLTDRRNNSQNFNFAVACLQQTSTIVPTTLEAAACGVIKSRRESLFAGCQLSSTKKFPACVGCYASPQ
jgi:hypothetical protein